MNPVFLIIALILSGVISIACIVGAVFIYKVYISTCSFKEFMNMVKTQGYLKSLFRFDKLVSPKILQFFYGLNALSVIGAGVIFLVLTLFLGISQLQFQLIVGGILGAIILIVAGEIFLRIGYEIAMLFFKMNESLSVLKEAQIARGFVEGEAADDRLATEALADTFNSIKSSVKGNQMSPQNNVLSVKVCPNCGIQNKPDARFCKGCGTAL